MTRNIIILILSTFLFNACDYRPIYSDKSVGDFSIEKISFNGDIEINNLIDKKLKNYQKTRHIKKI